MILKNNIHEILFNKIRNAEKTQQLYLYSRNNWNELRDFMDALNIPHYYTTDKFEENAIFYLYIDGKKVLTRHFYNKESIKGKNASQLIDWDVERSKYIEIYDISSIEDLLNELEKRYETK